MSARGLCCLWAIALLAAARPGGGAERITLTVWDWHAADPSKGVGLWLTRIDREFERRNPHVTIAHVAQSHNEYYQIFKAAASSRSGPDVVMLHQGSRVLDSRQSLRPLTEFVTPAFRDRIVGWDLTSEGYDPRGTPYAVPVAVQGILWYYNKKVLREAGVDAERPPQSWDAFLAACDAAKRIGKAGIAVGEREGHWAEWFVNSACFQALTQVEQQRLASGGLPWTDPKVSLIFSKLKELADRGCFQKGFMSTALWPDARYVFLRGDAAFFLGLISDVAHWKEFAEHFGPENVGVMTCPVFRPGPDADRFPIGGAFAYAVTEWSKHPREAFEYIELVVSDENARAFLTDVGSFPANQSCDRSLITNPAARKIADWIAAGRTGTQMTGKMTMRVNDAIMRQSQCLLSGQADVARAMAAIQVRQTPPPPARGPSPVAIAVIFVAVLGVFAALCRAFAGRRKGVEAFRGRPAALAGYLFLLPAGLLLIVFRLLPAGSAVWHSFAAWDGVGAPSYVGLANYATLLRDDVFWRGTVNNFAVMLTIPLWILVSLLLALLIHQEVFGWRFFRAAFFAPAVLSPVIVGTLFCAFLGPDGPVNQALGAVGLRGLALDWLGDPHSALPTLVMVILWGVFGHGVIVFLAGLAAVPRETFEAARLDGATGWRFLWHVVVPSLRHVIEFWGVNLVIWSFTSLFAFVYVMSQGGPGYATMLVSYQVYQEAFELESMGYACAVGTALLLMVFGLALIQIRLMAGEED